MLLWVKNLAEREKERKNSLDRWFWLRTLIEKINALLDNEKYFESAERAVTDRKNLKGGRKNRDKAR